MTPTDKAVDGSVELTRRRLDRAIEALKQHDCDAMLITNLKNIRYLTGFSGSNAALLLRRDGEVLLGTDGRYTTQVKAEAPGLDVLIDRDTVFAVRSRYSGTIGVESSMTLSDVHRLGEYTVIDSLVETLREIKDDSEIEALQAAARVADRAWQSLLDDKVFALGVSEKTIAAELEYRMRRFGADGVSFDTIVASGTNGAKPHHGASDDGLTPGLITVDFGVWLNGYASDQTRMVSLGTPSAEQQKIVDTVYESFLAGCEAVKPGAKLWDVDHVCRKIIEDAGYGEYFVHSTGHGVGLDVHEAPYAASRTPRDCELSAGNTLTIEPGIYVPGLSGARIENTLVVTEDGSYALNTTSPQLFVIE